MATNYEDVYKQSKNALGEPNQLVQSFFEDLNNSQAHVLDIGCGQGRDAIFIARLGHIVTGVDLSPTGIADLAYVAAKEGLSISTVVADTTDWQPDNTFDVILFDRVLHMLTKGERGQVLARLINALNPGGFILILDEKPNMPLFERVLGEDQRSWSQRLRKSGNLIVRDITT